ncbi:L-asparaginase 1 [Acinetobacter sp. NCu2D-2]|uniref:asparaginase domain-containing protein n=1 Tax=Acinetobacter sp. NCu2D-2 TaxID=1608473 RepID=UPI0007CDF908|nr:asparaginase domain-containing protein [Acinetobacter sp. NCu2D-2]ANF80975.1 L-asparaginase 1 [Acinetobacter sp. NCu2D-2]
MKETIALIYMGGTFGCVGNPLSPMSAELFIPQLERYCSHDVDVTCFKAPTIKDSSACTAIDWLELIRFIQSLIAQKYQYFVIIHGTDTLSYASAVLSHFLANQATVILTGSQYPLLNVTGDALREFSDANNNLQFALQSVLKTSPGVYLAFNQHLFHARSALKQHTTELHAFHGLDSDVSLPIRHPLTVTAAHIKQADTFNCMSCMMQPIELEQQVQNLQNVLNHPPHFLILQGFGTGNLAVNQPLIQLIDQLYDQGCATILTTQVPFGGTDQRYAIADWVKDSKVLLNDSYGHADLYAKALKMYLQYDRVDQWHAHWYE